ncbi:MAG: hypothetical protein N0C88_15130 [Candidatus Thiodiazotropha lotti]|uniref:Uncharacterized protein n=1 Tax=Candidatus Thiodiazotropha lotti TaxID=2792787 RepID=A0A9E4K6E9_9GAMM|nr:hypothetical protein [Candidatus Thiodiazotropha lotti]ODC01390.1 hypothetical protein A3197_02610 [Candidatus Thiodiazotropha endoloripes]MCG7940162.1 hypothetical protein [Candidatus Thiodiazotropha lotti]MCG7988363.1 hypothetical protein [Candidatus Thiodiazotropha lotti]MCG8010760.1 hypothetical protein [Candidatus Thiodiazotropha lotti]
MIKAYSQRLMPPYSGLVQIVESETARALTLDVRSWEIHFLYDAEVNLNKAGQTGRRRFIRVQTLEHEALRTIAETGSLHGTAIDDRIVQLAEFLVNADYPFPSDDLYEYWILDPKDDSPLALVFSCNNPDNFSNFPTKTDWRALPAAVMPIEYTESEKQNKNPPVNYRVEQMVTKRAGYSPKAKWFKRGNGEVDYFPPVMIREDWGDEQKNSLCQRYIQRLAPRLLMLHGLGFECRKQLETSAGMHALEVERFHRVYPEIADKKRLNTILVEARIRRSTNGDLPLRQR